MAFKKMAKKLTVVINLKTYRQGKNVVKLARKISKVRKKVKDLIVGVQASDVYEVSKNTGLKVFSQHVDPVKPGRHTGFIVPEAVKKDGSEGSFINHSEHKVDFKNIKKTIKRCKEVKLKTAVFVPDLKLARKVEKLNPDYLIYEPPELVAGKKSVSKAKPEIISKIAEKIKMPFLVGAGIKTKKDVEKALNLGADGIAVSSAITKAGKPGKKLEGLLGL